jgi:hypothetical protein
MKVSGQMHVPAALPMGKSPPVPIIQKAGLDAVEKILLLLGIEPLPSSPDSS